MLLAVTKCISVTAVSEGVRVWVRVKAGSARPAVGGSWPGRNGPALLVAVAERAVAGRANEAVCAAVAGACGLARHAVRLVTGARGRDKLLELAGDPQVLADCLSRLRGGVS